MKVPVSWLKQHLETTCSTQELIQALGRLGLVVDGVNNPGAPIHSFKIVEVLETNPHPHADRLKVCRVNTGLEALQIVCGDPKVRAGMKTVLGRPGDYVPGLHITLKEAKIRGVESQGMLCSLAELGLADTSSGIVDLPRDAPLGKTYATYRGLDDDILDVDVTPNRGDCLGVRGIARDLYAAGIGQLRPLRWESPKVSFTTSFKVVLEEERDALRTACPYFVGRVIRNVKNGESPLWLQNKLRAVGVKSISLLVDITNYLAYEIGRPLHVFDYDHLEGSLRLRFAQEGEPFLALDGQTYSLKSGMLVVADEKGPQALAGIMGGLESGCQMDTTTVFLESAYFEPKTIGRTGRALGIVSDARHRFERGIDPGLVLPGLDYATRLILDLCGGEASQVITVGQEPDMSVPIRFDLNRIESLGGLSLAPHEALAILERLGFKCQESHPFFLVTVPSWRSDVMGPHDLVEEVLRVKGYDAIPLHPLPAVSSAETFSVSSAVKARRERQWIARRTLAARGLTEVLTWSFMKEEEARCFNDISPSLILTNPISSDLSTMRPTLVGSLAKCLQRNKDRGLMTEGIFEVALDYQDATPDGQRWVVAAMRPGYYQQRHWRKPKGPLSVYDVKADVMAVLKAFGIDDEKVQLYPQALRYYHPGQSAALKLESEGLMGYVGTLHPGVAEALKVEGPLCMFELFLENVPVFLERETSYVPLALQPLERDLAFIVDEEVSASSILEAVKKVNPAFIQEADIFDVYRGPGVPLGKKSVALWYVMQPQDKTLTDDQIHETMQAIITAVEKVTKGSLRQ